ncbi:ribonuclease HII [bacterium]|nr:ribonuclease HII [bacterium]
MINLKKEKEIFSKGYKLVGGVDEAGRGPLAGPVVAACVIIDQSFDVKKAGLEKVNDSKALSAKKRQELFGIIKKEVLGIGIALCSNKTIDKINILQASLLACKKSVEQLKEKPDYVFMDGKFKIPNLNIPQEAIIQGDKKVFCIAAASIIAKVTRDYLMTELDKKYPQYEFSKHKGYGTKLHLEKILKNGPSDIHRMSFSPCSNYLKNK